MQTRRPGTQMWLGTGAPPGAVRDFGAATLPQGHVDSSTGTKGPVRVPALLPQASRGCLPCCFEDGFAPTPLTGFLPPQSCCTCQT